MTVTTWTHCAGSSTHSTRSSPEHQCSRSTPSVWLPPGTPRRSQEQRDGGVLVDSVDATSASSTDEWAEWTQAVARSARDAQRRSSGSPDWQSSGSELAFSPRPSGDLSPTEWQLAVAQSRAEAQQRELQRSQDLSSSAVEPVESQAALEPIVPPGGRRSLHGATVASASTPPMLGVGDSKDEAVAQVCLIHQCPRGLTAQPWVA